MATILGKAPMARVTALAAVLVAPLLTGIVSTPAAEAQHVSSDSPITPEQIQQNRYEQARPRTAIPFNPSDFDKLSATTSSRAPIRSSTSPDRMTISSCNRIWRRQR